MTDLHIKWATLFGVYPSRVMTENCAPVSIQVSVDAVTSRGPLRTRFESVATCGNQAPVGWVCRTDPTVGTSN